MNAGGLVVSSTGVSGLRELDRTRGTARVLAGTSLDSLLREIVPQGWFVPVTPGTRCITVGGAIAADVHGKDHHATGSFGAHVESLVLALPDGTRRTLTPHEHADEFWATCGGMGLTGTIVEATIRLHAIETSLLRVDTDRVPDLDTLLTLVSEGGRRHRYSVAWLDFMARGRSLGRSVLTQGDFARRDELVDLSHRAVRRGAREALA
jgi:decaprenylphospho-beta-D-ribofuranose 2-oxidase